MPHLIQLLMAQEGESLTNDATSIVLFEIFLDMVNKLGQRPPSKQETLSELGTVAWKICWLTVGMSVSTDL